MVKFFRRQTDEVYSTLQQVQRRMSTYDGDQSGQQSQQGAPQQSASQQHQPQQQHGQQALGGGHQPTPPPSAAPQSASGEPTQQTFPTAGTGAPQASEASQGYPQQSAPSPQQQPSYPGQQSAPPPQPPYAAAPPGDWQGSESARPQSGSLSDAQSQQGGGFRGASDAPTRLDSSHGGTEADSSAHGMLQAAAAAHATRPHGVFLGVTGLSLTMLTVLVLCVLAFMLGHYTGSGRALDPIIDLGQFAGGGTVAQESIRQPTVEPTPTGPPTTNGGDGGEERIASTANAAVLILQSVPKSGSSQDTLNDFRTTADKLNQVVNQRPDLDIPPYFGVRRPRSGGLQLIFGVHNGTYGVDRSDFERVRKTMRADPPGYTDAYWLPLK